MGVPFGFVVGNKWYAVCDDCHRLVRVDKPLIGSWHVCLSEEERQARAEFTRQQQAQPPSPVFPWTAR